VFGKKKDDQDATQPEEVEEKEEYSEVTYEIKLDTSDGSDWKIATKLSKTEKDSLMSKIEKEIATGIVRADDGNLFIVANIIQVRVEEE